jgi:dipeptidyl aminopeptidase/acylaminoacyl peptidase
MIKKAYLILAAQFAFVAGLYAQQLGSLTVEKIMRDPKWIGTQPNNFYWSDDSRTVYFDWNPEKAHSDSLYSFSVESLVPVKVNPEQRRMLPAKDGDYNRDRSQRVYEKNGDIFLVESRTGQARQLTNTFEAESTPQFSFDGKKVYFASEGNAFSLNLSNGTIAQVTSFKKGKKPDAAEKTTQLETWLKAQQTDLIQVVKERTEKEKLQKERRELEKGKRFGEMYIEDKKAINIKISPDEKFVTFNLLKTAPNAKNTIVPDYVTSTGYTTDLKARSKVGSPQSEMEFWVIDFAKDTAVLVSVGNLPGINSQPDFLKDYKKEAARPAKKGKKQSPKQSPTPKSEAKKTTVYGPTWSHDGKNAAVVVRSADNKDRWIALLDPATGKVTNLDHQHDEAWIGGPGINSYGGEGTIGWLADNEHVWFHSEESGYSHLYTVNIRTGKKQALTKGNYEVQEARLSLDKQNFYLITNEVHPGEQHFYKMPVSGGKATKLTALTGAHEVSISPDEKMLAIRYSYINKPWELYLMRNEAGAQMQQVTKSVTPEFASYKWREPEVVTFKARDGANVHARLFRPENAAKGGPAVVFVHGAGYLQNAHKWWSSYFREYMFHNLLAEKGYTVLDIDYRGSAGYGRDWRTGIYRHMGGKDLTDQVDGVKYLQQQFGIDSASVGIYGGSYGGFITLMAMFTEPDVFAAGAALRSVTDWAHYNHGYTSNILNEPYTDSLAYVRSSPIYFAEGLKGALLMCHGMVDVNVHFQDIVRLSQRLIELGKDNWELAVYPVEDHGFVEPSSWTDEYKRILKLFEQNLKGEKKNNRQEAGAN